MGPLQQAIRTNLRAPRTLHTLGQGKPFVLERIDENGIVLLLGKRRNYTPLGWECLEIVNGESTARVEVGVFTR